MLISPSTLDRTESALRALVSPLGHPSIESWFASASVPIKELFAADHISLLSSDASASLLYSDLEPSARTAYAEAYGAQDQFLGHMIHSGMEVGHPWMVTPREELIRTEFYNDFLLPHSLGSALAIMSRGRGSTWHAVSIAFRRHVDESVLEQDLALLRLLAPALRAGLDVWGTFGSYLGVLSGELDGVGVGCLVSDLAGRPLHTNTALQRMMAAEPDRAALQAAVEGVARTLGAVASGALDAATAIRDQGVHTPRARYRLHGSMVEEGILGPAPLLLVTVENRTLTPMTDEELRERYGLTRREIVVARLVAEGLTNPQIARRLWISPYTARNHVERLLQKLEVGSRAGVGARLGGRAD